MNKDLPQQLDRESLSHLSKEELVDIIIEQASLPKGGASLTRSSNYSELPNTHLSTVSV
ncbi:MAG: hypothetical protein KME30_12795 [Iphinoe sp. HA4291-MV1]|nr:hypothetical protein [Iphinoe sp. HA4291-MV1]